MKFQLKGLVVLVTVFSFIIACSGPAKKTTQDSKKPVYEANWESIKKNYKDPEWFNKTKFGI